MGLGSQKVPGFFVGAIIPAMPNFVFNTFDPRFSTFTLNFRLTDSASHASGMLAFPGYLSGFQDVGAGFTAYYGKWPSIYVAPTAMTQFPTGPTSQSITLGSNRYTVTLNPFSYTQADVPTAPNCVPSTPECVQVDVSPVAGPPSSTPEPSSMLLGIIGLFSFVPFVWRWRSGCRH
jgi:hypothetical protein